MAYPKRENLEARISRGVLARYLDTLADVERRLWRHAPDQTVRRQLGKAIDDVRREYRAIYGTS
jgi:hypothetical protein